MLARLRQRKTAEALGKMLERPAVDKMRRSARRRERHLNKGMLRRCIEFDESHWPAVHATD